MRDYLTLGSTPSDEPCAQVGSPDYSKKMRMETRAFINQMERVHPSPDNDNPVYMNASTAPYYACKAFPHDFGTYHEVCVIYDTDHEPSVRWACKAEELTPEKWDSQASNELVSMGYVFDEE